MAKVLGAIGWLLVALAILVIAYPLVAPSATWAPLTNALPAGVLVALAGQLLSQSKAAREEADKLSRFYLESAVKAYEQARLLLQDGNNERVRWIAAGRALRHAKELAKSITESAHQRVLELDRLQYRGFFGALLTEKPAAFFYGAADVSVPIEEAAAESSRGEERNGRPVISGVRDLSEKALQAVWEAAQWPNDYQDPLAEGFSPEDEARLLVLYPGLHEFLEHKEQWHSVAGQLHPRAPRNAAQQIVAAGGDP